MADTETTAKIDGRAIRRSTRLVLLVIRSDGAAETHALPESGSISIGRSPENQIHLDEPSISRRHAVLHVGPQLRVEDLGSANGTRVRDARLDGPGGPGGPGASGLHDGLLRPGAAVDLSPGDVIHLGTVTAFVQYGAPAARPRRRRPHGGALERPEGRGSVLVEDPAMLRLYQMAQRVADSSISVLLLGETGVGKEVLAEAIHTASPRASGAFLRLNCAAFSEQLLESELFGYEKGAFTGAAHAKPGLLETASGGTVFLDEVGELPMATQVKLLRVLEERAVLHIGGLKPRPIDVRFVAATNRDLEREIERGAFRQDLFFRLNGISLVIPPLRERTGEIVPFARAFVAELCRKAGRHPAPALSEEAAQVLLAYSWPGNIRELRNVIERAVLLCGDGPITGEHLPAEKMGERLTAPRPLPAFPLPAFPLPAFPPPALAPPALAPAAPSAALPLAAPSSQTCSTYAPPADAAAADVPHARPTEPVSSDTQVAEQPLSTAEMKRRLCEAERARVLAALERCAGNQTQAAKLLGVSRRTLVTRLEEYGLPRPRKAVPPRP